MYINEQIQVLSLALLAVVSFGQENMVSLRIIPIHKIILLFCTGEDMIGTTYRTSDYSGNARGSKT
ncbi:hypothetical protein ACQKCH_11265 [Nubsella zeaxanthinifaciens]|uniref:hypothetical protein n=1 Tax=Nubsella zeaxanthinifaciens TaxID=392412 RepID=UPI003CFD1D19